MDDETIKKQLAVLGEFRKQKEKDKAMTNGALQAIHMMKLNSQAEAQIRLLEMLLKQFTWMRASLRSFRRNQLSIATAMRLTPIKRTIAINQIIQKRTNITTLILILHNTPVTSFQQTERQRVCIYFAKLLRGEQDDRLQRRSLLETTQPVKRITTYDVTHVFDSAPIKENSLVVERQKHGFLIFLLMVGKSRRDMLIIGFV